MKRELVDEANKIIKRIEETKDGICKLSMLSNLDGRYGTCKLSNHSSVNPEPICFDTWEIQLMIRWKKKKLKELEAELERL